MNRNSTLQSMLVHIARDADRPEEIDLWPSIRIHLAAGVTCPQAKEQSMKTKPSNRTLKHLAFAGVLGLLLALGIVLAFPQGRAWADQMLHFFIRTEDTIPLPTPLPVDLVDVTPGAALATLTPIANASPEFASECGGWLTPHCPVAQIREMVAFPVKQIAALPEGMKFTGATGGTQGVTLVYQRDDPLSMLLLAQSPATPENETASPVGKSAVVEQIPINGALGEYVQGSYQHYGGDVETTWDAHAQIHSLRWKEHNLLYTMTLIGSSDFSPQPLDKTALAGLAASLTEGAVPAAAPADEERPQSISQLEQAAGFTVIEPSRLPEEYRFERATYNAHRKTVCLEYRHPADVPLGNPNNDPAPSLTVTEGMSAPWPDLDDLVVSGLRPEQILLEKADLSVGGASDNKGLYYYGSLDLGQVCRNPSLQNQALLIQTKGLYVAILAVKGGPQGDDGNRLTQQEMVRLAESITDVQIIGVDRLDPQNLTSIADIKKMTTLPLKFPSKLPQGMGFSHGQVLKQDPLEKVTQYYSDGNQVIEINLTKGSSDTLDKILERQPQIYRRITIHDQPALITQGYWSDDQWKELPNGGDGGANVTWLEDGILYSVGGFNAYPREVWIEIAAGLQ